MLPVENKIIVIDAGHGGFDPGKEGSSGGDEKDINLSIASYLQQYLEQSGANVIMTRTDDSALGTTKKEDMSKEGSLIEDSGADISISVHQNSYSGAGVSGAQVFTTARAPKGSGSPGAYRIPSKIPLISQIKDSQNQTTATIC